MNLGIRNPGDIPEGRPTYENLAAHVDRWGLDREAKGYHQGKEKDYSTYRQFRSDSAVEVARSYFTESVYVRFVSKYGSHQWEDEARKDWQEENDDD